MLRPTHVCKICGAFWRLWHGSWSLVSDLKCGKCCDNVEMGDQIELLEEPDDKFKSEMKNYIVGLKSNVESIELEIELAENIISTQTRLLKIRQNGLTLKKNTLILAEKRLAEA